jgi:hypothetical protein
MIPLWKGKNPIYFRVIELKLLCGNLCGHPLPAARHTQSHNTARLETGV